MSYLPVSGFGLVFPVLFIPGVISGVLLVNFLSCSSVAITQKTGRAMSGSSSALLRRRPLRTVRAGFPAYRSSLYKYPLWAPASLLCN